MKSFKLIKSYYECPFRVKIGSSFFCFYKREDCFVKEDFSSGDSFCGRKIKWANLKTCPLYKFKSLQIKLRG